MRIVGACHLLTNLIFCDKIVYMDGKLSFADGCSCGDGTIYRASNFVLTSIKRNTTIKVDEHGNKVADMTFSAHKPSEMKMFRENYKPLDGFMLRHVYFIDKRCKEKLTVPIIPFSKIDEMGAGMYKGEKISQTERHIDDYTKRSEMNGE